MVRVRVLFGLLMIIGLTALLWADGYLAAHHGVGWAPLFFVVIVLLATGGAYELTAMLCKSGARVRWWLSVPASAGILIAAAVAAARDQPVGMVVWTIPMVIGPEIIILGTLLLTVLVLEVVRAARIGDFDTPVAAIGGTMLVPLYTGLLLLPVVWIRFLEPNGLYYLVLFVAVCKLSDVGAYFTGKAVGRRKMVPRLSPGKTWEGLAGGLLLSVIAAIAIGMPLVGLGWLEAIVFGLAVAVASVLGDLAESLLKRSCKIKDSGQVLPEFGGVLDIVDSILVSAPVGYVLLAVMSGRG
jgi:phosphatidate cytidylyltransferase